MGKRIVNVATCGLHGNEGHDFAGPRAFGIHGCAQYDILRERRAVDGEVALEKGVPRDASDVFLAFQRTACPRRFRSRLATIRELLEGSPNSACQVAHFHW
jgi:hypothetical protein